jgi:di/tricarboxylate transporter
MALHEIEIFVIVAAMFALFFTERLRYDVIGAIALLAAVTTGCLPGDKAFLGFSNPVIIIIIASVLVLSRAIEGSGVLDAAMRHVLRRLHSPDAQIGVLVAGVTLLSAFMKNIGALALFLPIAVNSARLSQRSASIYLMPLAFGSLIGGTITLIGTSPNLVIASFRKDFGGQAFRMFDFAPVGAPLAILAVLYLTWGWRLLPKARAGSAARAAPPSLPCLYDRTAHWRGFFDCRQNHSGGRKCGRGRHRCDRHHPGGRSPLHSEVQSAISTRRYSNG